MRRIKLNEILVPLICGIVLIVVSISLFQDLTGRSKSEGEVIGFITYRYRVAQRRAASRVVWEDAEQKDSVYNQDTIRTDEKSEALVTLRNGTMIELDPQSMVVLSMRNDAGEIKLAQGSVVLRKPTSEDRLTFEQGGKTEFIKPTGELRLTLNGKSAEASGSFEFERKGESFKSERDSIRVEESRVERSRPSFSELFPPDNFRVFTDRDRQDITFTWAGAALNLEVSESRSFSSPLLRQSVSGVNSFKTPLPEGIYYWRILAEGKTSLIHKFRIVRTTEVRLLSPIGNIDLRDDSPFIEFAWSESRLAVSYHLRVATDAQWKNVVLDKEMIRNSGVFPLPPGEYYWQVEAVGALPGSNSSTSIQRFSVKDARVVEKPADKQKEGSASQDVTQKPQALPDKPEGIVPSPGSVVDMSTRDTLAFQWKPVNGAQRYTIILYQAGGVQVYRVDTKQSMHVLTDLSVLDTGSFAYEIRAYTASGESSSGLIPFSVSLGAQLEKPRLKN